MSRKLKVIIGNGPRNSRVVDAETGETIEGVRDCSISIDRYLDFTPVITLTLVGVEMELAKRPKE